MLPRSTKARAIDTSRTVIPRIDAHEFSAWNLGPEVVGARIDPFLAIDHFVMRAPVFPPHPHAGFSAVTYLFEDSEDGFTNRDSLGTSVLIPPGALHWTCAARGVVHEEIPRTPGAASHGLQIFVNLRASDKHAPPSVHHLEPAEIPERRGNGVRTRVVVGSSGDVRSPLAVPTPVTLLDVTLDAGAALEHELRAEENAFVYVLEGEVRDAAGRAVGAREVGTFGSDGDAVVLTAGSRTRAVVFAGAPLGERVVSGGPFMMSSEEEIARAFADYRAGRMGHLEPSPVTWWRRE